MVPKVKNTPGLTNRSDAALKFHFDREFSKETFSFLSLFLNFCDYI